jgi:hypothetical protein
MISSSVLPVRPGGRSCTIFLIQALLEPSGRLPLVVPGEMANTCHCESGTER